jgi:CO/xanthine dehydrogenase Mo-binding subunit
MECLNAVVDQTDYINKWRQYEAERKGGRPDDGKPIRGIGLSLFWHGAGFTGNGERVMKCVASVRPRSDGRVEVLASSTDIGQGTETIFAQIVSDVLGVGPHHIFVPPPDTAQVPDSGPTVASRTVMVVGAVLTRAAQGLKDALVAEVGSSYADNFVESVKAYVQAHGESELTGQFQPREDDAGFDEKTYRGDAYSCYGWGCDVVEVEVDPDTLAVRPIKVTTAIDVGKAIHPILCRGQIEGGTLQAVAWGYLEEIKLEKGHYMNDRLTNYIIPTSMDAPLFETIIVENPANEGPFGAKGVGEIPMDGGAPAVVAAIENATGIVVTRIPATPEQLLMDFRAGKTVKDR